MDSLTERGPVRHGKTRWYIVINDDVYLTRKVKTGILKLTKTGGDRAGASYLVGRTGELAWCTCPDAVRRDSSCKHLRAVLANRLLPRPRPRKVVAR